MPVEYEPVAAGAQQHATHNVMPSKEMLKRIEDLPLKDREGKTFAFQDLYQGDGTAERVLFIFIRHFYCTACQEYIRQLSQYIKPEEVAALPTSTSIVLIGQGASELIEFYVNLTKWPFLIYTDPSMRLHGELGFHKALKAGPVPATYIQKSVLRLSMESWGQIFSKVPEGLAHKAGDGRLNGGEFLYEWVKQEGADEKVKTVTWCNRMRGSGDHAELPELRHVLGLKQLDEKPDGLDAKVWNTALTEFRGIGQSVMKAPQP